MKHTTCNLTNQCNLFITSDLHNKNRHRETWNHLFGSPLVQGNRGPNFSTLPKATGKRNSREKDLNLDSLFPIGVRPHIHSIDPNRRGDLTAQPLLWASSLLRSPPLSSHHHLLVTREPHLSHFRSSVWASGEESHNSLDKLAHVLLRPGCRIIKQALEATGRINTLFGDGGALSN